MRPSIKIIPCPCYRWTVSFVSFRKEDLSLLISPSSHPLRLLLHIPSVTNIKDTRSKNLLTWAFVGYLYQPITFSFAYSSLLFLSLSLSLSLSSSSLSSLSQSSSSSSPSSFVNLIMGPRRRRYQRWYTQPLAPLIEGPDPDTHGEGGKKEKSWDIIRAWVRSQVEKGSSGGGNFPISIQGNVDTPRPDLKLLLGVLGCPLAPVSLLNDPISHISIKDTPIETSSAHYIIQQYLAATGCLKLEKCVKSSYVVGTVKMVCCETEIASGKNVRSVGTRGGENGCFVLWQMLPGMWSVEMVVAGNKVVAGSNGKIVWRHVPWLGTHAAKGPQRPLRRIIQGLDPKSTASMFARAQCLGEKRIGNDDCFVLKVAADRATIVERSDGPAEVIRHVLYGYFSQRSGLLVYMEDSHLTRVQAPGADTVYWETTIGSSIEDYRQVDGVLIAHGGRSVATVFRFGEVSMQQCRTRMEETWTIDDVVFNVPGLSMDYFIPPADILDATSHIS